MNENNDQNRITLFIEVRNSSPEKMKLYIEPRGDLYTLKPETTKIIAATGPDKDLLEVEYKNGVLELVGWSGSVLEPIEEKDGTSRGADKNIERLFIKVRNSSPEEMQLAIEPWADFYTLNPETTKTVFATGTGKGLLEMDYDNGALTLWAWRESILEFIDEADS